MSAGLSTVALEQGVYDAAHFGRYRVPVVSW